MKGAVRGGGSDYSLTYKSETNEASLIEEFLFKHSAHTFGISQNI